MSEIFTLDEAQAERIRIGIALGQTAYALNNGNGILVGEPLTFVDDVAALDNPNARPLNVSIPPGFVVEGVYKDVSTGLDVFMAYNRQSGQVFIGVGGTNGIPDDRTDTAEDLLRLGTGQVNQLFSSDQFRADFNRIASDAGGLENLSNVLIAGQSLGGGMSPLIGMAAVYGVPSAGIEGLGLSPSQISVVAINGFGSEYTFSQQGYALADKSAFEAGAEVNNLIVYNTRTNTTDFVSQLGGDHIGNSWALDVTEAEGVGALHQNNRGVAEGVDAADARGGLTMLRPVTINPANHETISNIVRGIDGVIPIENNLISLTWAGYVGLLLSTPGEGANLASRALQSMGASQSLAESLGAVAEIVLRGIPLANIGRAAELLVGMYGLARALGSDNTLEPVFPPPLEGYARELFPPPGTPAYEQGIRYVVDYNNATNAVVVRFRDGTTEERTPTGEFVITRPGSGLAIFTPDGGGSLYLSKTNTQIQLGPNDSVGPLGTDAWQVTSLMDDGRVRVDVYNGSHVSTSIGEYIEVPEGNNTKRIFRPIFTLDDQIPQGDPDLIKEYDPYAPQGGVDRRAISAYIDIEGQRVLVRYEPDSRTGQLIATGAYIENDGVIQPLAVSADVLRIINQAGVSPSELVALLQLGSTITNDVPASPQEAAALAFRSKLDATVKPAAFNFLNYQDRQITAVLGDISGIINAIKGGKPLPILASGVHLLNDVVNSGTTIRNSSLDSVNTVVNGIQSLYSLQNAFKNGDTLDQITATASTINYVNNTFFASAIKQGGTLASDVSSILNGTAGKEGLGLINGGTPGVLGALGLINSIRVGDPIGIVQGVIGLINPTMLSGPVGWALIGYQILTALFDEPPEAWGITKVVFDDAYGTRLDTIGEAFGKDRVAQVQQGVLDYFNALIGQSQSENPRDPLGIIPQRMPTLTWREQRQGDPGFAITDIDPLTGAQRYPYLRFDDNGMPFSADPSKYQVDPTDKEQRVPFQQALLYSALRRGALAPLWEVKTAKMQQDAGDPNAGLTEEERDARAGLSAAVDPATNKRDPGRFRPVLMDMNGDGQITTVGKAQSDVTFDWDDSGFQKKTAWAAQGEGFLFLDRNPNGNVDSGKELLSNSLVADAAKGVRSLAWVDGNAGGKINYLDPVFNELKIWQDNGDGIQQEGEVKKLGDLGVTEIDYQMGRFIRNGQYYAMSSPELEADSEGAKINMTEAGIRVESTNGEIKLYVYRVSSLTAGNDGVVIPEDGDSAPRTTPVRAVIPVDLLLANDEVNGVNTGLTITAVGNAAHGSVTFGNDPMVGPAVFFTPDANYNGPASFEYTLTAYNGMARTATVDVAVTPVNDVPIVYDQRDPDRPIYGYTMIDGGEQGYADDIVGPAIYSPYVETVLVPRYGDTSGESGYEESYVQHNTPIASDSPDSGRVEVSDPDGPSHVSYQIISQAVYGTATIDPNSGAYSYVGRRPRAYGLDFAGAGKNIDSNQYLRDEEKFTDVFTVRVTDLSDPTGNTYTDRDVPVTHYGPRPVPEVQDGGKKPIAVDLNGDGFHFSAVDDSNVFFDVNGDGWRRKIAWNNPDDGFIAFDKNGDGKIDRFDEISFVPYKPDGQTDLEGLQAFDTNHDGVFSAEDADWSNFGIWQDANSDGITDAGEFNSFDQMGIHSIALTSDGQFQVIDGQTVHGTATAAKTDGSTLAIADVTLQYKNVTQVTQADGSTVELPISKYQQGQTFNGTPDNDLVFGTAGSDRFVMRDGDDTVVDDSGNDFVEAGTGNDLIYTGNDNDAIDAAAGNDTVFAGNGNDVIFGGDGDDLLLGENGNDVAFGGNGNDFISGGLGNDVLSGNAGDDKLVGEDGFDALFGQEGDDELYGNAGNDLLYGGEGNDILDGGIGDDQMEGDAGNDIYVVDSGADHVVEEANAGIDTVMSSINYTLGGNVENLTLTGIANLNGTGNDLDNTLVGNSGENVLIAGAGNDTLDGGRGSDTLIGGLGNDTYVVDNLGDVVVENANEGTDTVRSRINYALGENVENLTLIGIDAIDGTGNAFDNVIIGNAASNHIDGGAGADEMRGGRGNDSYIVENAGDLVIENVGEGIDSVESSIDYTLTANVEDLQLKGNAIRGIGNDLDNVLLGNAQDNILDGGAGSDLLAGAAGNDTYFVDDINDVVIENMDGGVDTVFASANFTLNANVENLTLTGTGILSGSGNELSNILTANDAGNALSGLAGDDILIGGAGSDRLDGGTGADWMSGGAGDDVYVVDDAGDQVAEQTGAGTDAVESSIDYTLTANVENLTLTAGAVRANGNELDNIIRGNTENDLIDGGSGVDTLIGAGGDDTYIVDNAGDIVVENADDGMDTVLAGVSYSLSANVENLTLTGNDILTATGNELGNVLTANNAGNMLYGMAGDDTLLGGAGSDMLDGGFGTDAMRGGAGDDTYIVDNANDMIVEDVDAGMDTVFASVSYGLSANVENLTLTGSDILTATGNELGNVITANDAGSILYGMAGDDSLVGGAGNDMLDGGFGADTMKGGAGDDTYVVDHIDDVVIEFFNAGNDTVQSSINYVLPENVENLILTGSATLTGGGNSLANVIVANDAGNTLYGLEGEDALYGGAGTDHLDGGIGADQMRGGAGDDIYVVDNAGDFVIEQAGAGTDLVESSIDYTLTADVENLTLTAGAISATGNELDNVIIGNAEDNLIDGAVGADTMIGGLGNDVYTVDNIADVVIEAANEGTDIVYASADHTLSENVENLTLTGSANLTATGNALANVLIVNSGNSKLYGLDGNDMLIGGAGNDLLDGGNGNDQLTGATGNDMLVGGAGDDTYSYLLGDGLDTVVDASGIDVIRFGPGLTLDNLALRIVTVNGQKMAQIRVLDANGDEQPDQGMDFAVTVTEYGDIVSPIEKFVLDNGQELVLDDLLIKCTFSVGTNWADILRGDRNDNIIFAANGNDTVYAGTGNDVVYGSGGFDLLYGGGGQDRLYGGAGNDTLYSEGGDDVLAGEDGDDRLIDTLGNNIFSGGGGNDYVEAGAGNDQIWTDGGRDIVQSGAGSDIVDAGDNNDLVDAGAGDDTISAGKGNDWIAAGKGDDTVDGGQGKNIFAFNRGDGRDTLVNGGWDNDTISLGGIRYANLELSKSGDDLVLDMGQNDSITLKNWYAPQLNRSVDRLQVVTLGADYDAASTDKTKNRQVEVFDFEKIVQRFDAARTANSANSTGWAAMNSMLDTYLLGSDTQALGGDLSFQYAAMGSLIGIGLNSAQSSLSAGTDLQKLKTRQQLELGAMHLS